MKEIVKWMDRTKTRLQNRVIGTNIYLRAHALGKTRSESTSQCLSTYAFSNQSQLDHEPCAGIHRSSRVPETRPAPCMRRPFYRQSNDRRTIRRCEWKIWELVKSERITPLIARDTRETARATSAQRCLSPPSLITGTKAAALEEGLPGTGSPATSCGIGGREAITITMWHTEIAVGHTFRVQHRKRNDPSPRTHNHLNYKLYTQVRPFKRDVQHLPSYYFIHRLKSLPTRTLPPTIFYAWCTYMMHIMAGIVISWGGALQCSPRD